MRRIGNPHLIRKDLRNICNCRASTLELCSEIIYEGAEFGLSLYTDDFPEARPFSVVGPAGPLSMQTNSSKSAGRPYSLSVSGLLLADTTTVMC
jgi:hypothetical protein